MAAFDDENPFGAAPRKLATLHEIGQNLDLLSVDELTERVDMLKLEVERLENARHAKLASRNAAAAFFKSPV
jgi:uncharacterized small protein (DUF1192 family)